MAIDTYTNTIYVSGPNVTEIDASNDKVVGAIPTPGRSSSIAVNPSTGLVYVNDENPCQNCTQGLFVINTGSRSVIGASMIRSINLEQYVSDIAVNSRTNMVYASSFGRTSLFIINGTTNAVVANVSLPGGFGTLAPVVSVNQFKNTVYVAACQGNSLGCSPTNVFAINGTSGSIIAQVPIEGGGEPLAMAVNPYIGEIYVTIQNELISINGSTYAETTDDVSALPLNCQGLATNFSNDILLSCSAMPDIPSFIVMNEGGSVINSFAQGGSPMGVAVGVDPEAVYLVNQNGYVLVVLYIPTSPLP